MSFNDTDEQGRTVMVEKRGKDPTGRNSYT